jgi:hypothetical protein
MGRDDHYRKTVDCDNETEHREQQPANAATVIVSAIASIAPHNTAPKRQGPL